jgi:hypothetical protein
MVNMPLVDCNSQIDSISLAVGRHGFVARRRESQSVERRRIGSAPGSDGAAGRVRMVMITRSMVIDFSANYQAKSSLRT